MRKTTFRSGIAVTASSLGVQLLGFVTTILLARLLDPSDFGIMRFAGVLIGTMNLFSGMGMGPALIASEHDKDRVAFHALVVTLISGTFFATGVFLAAPALAAWFGRTELTNIIRWMSAGVVLMTLRIVPYSLLAKDMMFGRRVVPDMSATLTRMAVAVTLAFLGYGVWSLVIGWIAERLIYLIVTIAVYPTFAWLRRQPWDRIIMKSLWRFGFTQMRTGLVQYAYNNGDDIIVGKVLGPSALGFYSQAYNLSNMPVQNISMVVNSVLLPAYAKIRDDKERLVKGFLASFQFVATLTLPVAMGMFVLAPELIVFLIGEKWASSIPILRVFAMMAVLRPISGSTSPLFLSIQKPEYNLRTAMIQGVSMFALIVFFIRWGATGVAIAVVTAFGLGFINNVYMACWKTGLSLRPVQLLDRVWPVLVSTLVMVAGVQLLKQPMLLVVGGTHNLFSLIVLVLAGVVTYIGVLAVLRRSLVIEIISLVMESVRRRAKK